MTSSDWTTTTAGGEAAGDFAAWVREMRHALRDGADAVVPCNGCTACCRASQFVHIGPEEKDTLSRIDKALLFPAPGLPHGHYVLGYDERGHCPMLVDDRCTIYEHRPRTCRTYDCRVFAATGVDLDDDTKAEVMGRVRQWRFSCDSPEDKARIEAMQAAARFLSAHPDVEATPTGRALAALHIHELFLDGTVPDVETVRSALTTP